MNKSIVIQNKVVSLHHNNNIKTYNNESNIRTHKNAVIAKLISWGNNEETVKDMVEKHFRYAFEHYATVKTIAECIRTIY